VSDRNYATVGEVVEHSTPPAESRPTCSNSQDRHGPRESQLVLSLFPGVDLLGRAFHAKGFSVVLGPDLLWDSRIEDFSCPADRFDGVIAGPPCVNYSDANRRRDTDEGDRLVREFLRVVAEAQPVWWMMENVRNVPDVRLRGYTVQRLDCTDWEFGGGSGRLRHIQFGHRDGHIIRPVRTQTCRPVTLSPVVTTQAQSRHDRFSRRCAKMGVTALRLAALTPAARRRIIGNGVPHGIGTALADAVLSCGPVTEHDCVCGCGRSVSPGGPHALPACRQRMCRRRKGRGRILTLDTQGRDPAAGG